MRANCTCSCQLDVSSVWPFLPAPLSPGEEWVPLCKWGLGLHEGSLHRQVQLLMAVGSVWPFLRASLSPNGRVGASLPVGTGLTRGLTARAAEKNLEI